MVQKLFVCVYAIGINYNFMYDIPVFYDTLYYAFFLLKNYINTINDQKLINFGNSEIV